MDYNIVWCSKVRFFEEKFNLITICFSKVSNSLFSRDPTSLFLLVFSPFFIILLLATSLL